MTEQIILVTGASGGIGAALARAHAQPGTTLLLWGRDRERSEETARQCRAKGADCRVEAFDLRNCDLQIVHLLAADNQMPIDIAILNAGLGGMLGDDKPAEDPQAARAIAEVDFVAPVIGANLLASAMAARGRGKIVLIGRASCRERV